MLLLPSAASADLSVSGVDGDIDRNVRAFATIATEPCNAEERVVRCRFRKMEETLAFGVHQSKRKQLVFCHYVARRPLQLQHCAQLNHANLTQSATRLKCRSIEFETDIVVALSSPSVTP
jgi:hypothetical protein